MATYSIGELEKLSGVKAHTIRMWEHRYDLLTPNRSVGNTRLYGDEEMRKLLNVASLVNKGFKISKISKLKQKELNKLIDESISETTNSDVQLMVITNQLISASLSYNEPLFEKAFSNAVLKYGLQETYVKVIYPLLVKIGLMWGKADMMPAQEHFVSNLLKQKLFHAIDSIEPAPSSNETWVLFLPQEEEHEIGLLFANYLLRLHKKNVIYLGQRVPYDNLKSVVEQIKPDCLQFFYVKNMPAENLQQFTHQISKDFPRTKLFFSAPSHLTKGIQIPEKCQLINDIDYFIDLLKK